MIVLIIIIVMSYRSCLFDKDDNFNSTTKSYDECV